MRACRAAGVRATAVARHGRRGGEAGRAALSRRDRQVRRARIRLDPVYAEFTTTEEDLTAAQKNMAGGKLAVEVRLHDEHADARTGELTFLDNTVLGTTGTVRLRATVPNADHRFWPGRFVKIRL